MKSHSMSVETLGLKTPDLCYRRIGKDLCDVGLIYTNTPDLTTNTNLFHFHKCVTGTVEYFIKKNLIKKLKKKLNTFTNFRQIT